MSRRKPLSGNILTRIATVTVNFASMTGSAMNEQTVTVSGAALGDFVVAAPTAAVEASFIWCAYVSAANTVALRAHTATGITVDPASVSWRIAVFKSF